MKLTASLAMLLVLLGAGCDHSSAISAPSPFSEVDQLMKKREWPEALARLEEMRGAQGAEPDVALRLAQVYSAKGEVARAISRLKEGLDAHPDAVQLYQPLALLYISLAQYPQARETLEKARANGLGDDKVALELGTCLGQAGDLDGAAREFDRALAAGQDPQVVNYNHALLLIQRKQFEQARVRLEELLAKEPTYAPAQRELARTLIALYPDKSDAVNRALDLCSDANARLKDDWRVFEVMGDGWMLVGDFDAAVEAYTEALRLGRNPKSVEDRYVVARKRQNEAKAAAGEAKIAPDDPAGSTPK